MLTAGINRRFAAALAALGLAFGTGCAINPVTGERELALVSEQQEIAMGRQGADQVRNSIGLVDNPALQEYVSELGVSLARVSERPDLPWEFRVVDDPTPNAFALPGGFIFVTRGLLTLLNSEAELVAVLGHEISHVTARHSVNQLSRAQLAQFGLGIGAIAAPETIGEYADLANTGVGLLFLKYGRDDERQADTLGFRYMLEHGYDVREMEDVFRTLTAAGGFAGASPVPAWLASHPSGPERIAAVRQRIENLPPGSIPSDVAANAYLREIDGLAYGQDPRQGFFDRDLFYHPELAFKFFVPSEWQRQNTAQAVMAASPDREIALQLTLAEEGGEAAAANRFFADANLNELDRSATRINGNRAIVSRFSAETPNGTVAGLVAHIDYERTVYRLLVYGSAQAFPSNRRMAEEVIDSFAPVTERSVLDAEAKRVRIVNVDGQLGTANAKRVVG